MATSEQVLKVLELIDNGKSERSACEEVGINRATFRSAALKEQAADHYARALSSLAADQVEKLEVAIEDMRKHVITAQEARVEIDARKWFASKFLPRQYGDKLDLTSGGDKLSSVSALTDTELDEKIASYLGRQN